MKTKNKRTVRNAFLGLLSLALLGTFLQSFVMNDAELPPKALSSYETTEITTYSFDCTEKVPERELLKAQQKIVNKRVELEVNNKNQVAFTTTYLDKPRSAHDLERLVSTAVYTKNGVQMYDFNNRPITTNNKPVASDQLDMTITNEQIERIGISPALTTISSKDAETLTKNGKKVTMLRNGAYAITDSETEVYVFPADGVVEMKHINPKTRLEEKITTFYKAISNDASIKAATITERSVMLSSGVVRKERVKTIFKNHYIAKYGKTTLDLRKSSFGGTK